MHPQEETYGVCSVCKFPDLPLVEFRGKVVVGAHSVRGGNDCRGCYTLPSEIISFAEMHRRMREPYGPKLT